MQYYERPAESFRVDYKPPRLSGGASRPLANAAIHMTMAAPAARHMLGSRLVAGLGRVTNLIRNMKHPALRQVLAILESPGSMCTLIRCGNYPRRIYQIRHLCLSKY
jgi:hypothetical protein